MVWVTLEKEKKILPCNWKYLHFKVNGTVEMESPSTKLKTGRLSIPVNRACSKYGNLHHAVLFRKKHALWKLNCCCSLPALKDKTKAQPCKTQSFVSEPLPPHPTTPFPSSFYTQQTFCLQLGTVHILELHSFLVQHTSIYPPHRQPCSPIISLEVAWFGLEYV